MSNEPAPLHNTEPDKPNVALITVFIVGTCSVVLALVIGLMQYFDFTIRAELDKKQYATESSALRRLRAEEQTKLSKINQAMEATLRDWNQRPAGVVAFQPAGPALAATPVAPAPAANPGAH